MQKFIFILPAAGKATRLAPYQYPKELLPVAYSVDGKRAKPSLVIEYSLTAMYKAGIRSGSVVINSEKLELLRYLGDGSRLGVSIVYAVQTLPTGLPQAIETMHDWAASRRVVISLPDTIFKPQEAVADVCRELLEHDADLVLGVFPTDQPERLGPVVLKPCGEVLAIQDKPSIPSARNTWGIAAWGTKFTRLLHNAVAGWNEETCEGEHSLGSIFDLAVRTGLNVRGIVFEEGSFCDLGTPEGIYKALIDAGVERNLETASV